MQTGIVYLVGAGSGDPGLITLRGIECLKLADLVLYDGLVNPQILTHTRARAIRTCRGESRAARSLKQQEINEQLIAAAREGLTVVRLKGGDPFVFGRGSEEAKALADAGLPFEVVPGVTAAVAAGAYAGFSLTHRDSASAVAFITGHEDPTKPEAAIDYSNLARFPGTLVFYMGLNRIAEISQRLIQGGLGGTTLSAVISRATTPHQRTITAPLSEIAAVVSQSVLVAPSLIIVGECVRQRESIAWYEQLPLFGLRIGITRAEDQAAVVVSDVWRLGAEPVVMPMIEIRPPTDWSSVDSAINQLEMYDWIVFTSTNGVACLLNRLWETGKDVRALNRARIAAIGSSTAASLAEWKLKADIVPHEYRAEALGDALASHVAGRRVLWVRASRGRDVLPNRLRDAGAILDEVVVYQNTDVAELPASLREPAGREALDWICLSSPSIARGVARLMPELTTPQPNLPRLAAISPVTASAAEAVGLTVATIASEFTWGGLLKSICDVVKSGT